MKVEKVVKPPQNPLAKRSLSFSVRGVLPKSIAERAPKNKQPIRLTMRVAHGKSVIVELLKSPEKCWPRPS